MPLRVTILAKYHPRRPAKLAKGAGIPGLHVASGKGCDSVGEFVEDLRRGERGHPRCPFLIEGNAQHHDANERYERARNLLHPITRAAANSPSAARAKMKKPQT